MDWFETMTGFSEADYDDTRAPASGRASRLHRL